MVRMMSSVVDILIPCHVVVALGVVTSMLVWYRLNLALSFQPCIYFFTPKSKLSPDLVTWNLTSFGQPIYRRQFYA
jgi:hypothetical protein